MNRAASRHDDLSTDRRTPPGRRPAGARGPQRASPGPTRSRPAAGRGGVRAGPLRAVVRRPASARAADRRGGGGPADVRRSHRLGGPAMGGRASGSTGSARTGSRDCPVTLAIGVRRHPQPAGHRGLAGTTRPARAHHRRRAARDDRRPVRLLRDAVRREQARGGRAARTWRRTPTWSRSRRSPSMRSPTPAGPASRSAATALGSRTRTAGRRGRHGMRLIWVLDAGFPARCATCPSSTDAGRHIGTPDLLDPEAGVVGEYDGALHLERAQRRHATAIARSAFRRVGLEYFTMVRRRLREPRGHGSTGCTRPGGAPTFARQSHRAWTLELPALVDPDHHCRPAAGPGPAQRERLLRCTAPPERPLTG